MMEEAATRYGAVETVEEGRKFARFLDENRRDVDGVIMSLPNFGDENGVIAALRDARVPILIHAYPDNLDEMAPMCARRLLRKAFGDGRFMPERRCIYRLEASRGPPGTC